MTVRIGLTGPIGCGKSTVAGWLGELGAVVVDADKVARDVTGPGSPALDAIARVFGTSLVGADGSLDRSALGRIVFADPDALARLEAIVHPAVRPAIMDAIADAERDGAPAVVVEAIKLVEGGLAELCDAVWLVGCDPGVQRARLVARGMPRDDAEQRLAAQGDLARTLRPFATDVIETSGTPAASRQAVLAAWQTTLRRLDARNRRRPDGQEEGAEP